MLSVEICGLYKVEYTFKGQANHAGTTPMEMRQNAFKGCARVQVALNDIVKESGSAESVATIGSVEVLPGSANVVPNQCKFTIETRDCSQEVLNRLSEKINNTVTQIAKEEDLEISEKRVMSNMEPVMCDPSIMHTIEDVADTLEYKSRVMPSGAAHDAQHIPEIGPMGMIFVPSINGISHDVKEDTVWEDVEAGANVLLNSLYRIGVKHNGID